MHLFLLSSHALALRSSHSQSCEEGERGEIKFCLDSVLSIVVVLFLFRDEPLSLSLCLSLDQNPTSRKTSSSTYPLLLCVGHAKRCVPSGLMDLLASTALFVHSR